MIHPVAATDQQRTRRGYEQFCPVATALDVVGERWTLLVVRDLLMGPKRYTDLREGLPGIATDLLAARLRTLEGAGLVTRRTLPRPAPATVYELTERGRQLGQVLAGLARVGFSLLDEPADDVTAPPERVVLALRPAFQRDAARDLEATYELVLGEETFVVTVAGGAVDTRRGTADAPDLTMRTDPVTLVWVLQGHLAPRDAVASGAVELEGPRRLFERFRTAFAWR